MQASKPGRRRARVPFYRYSSFWLSVAMVTFGASTLIAILQGPRDPWEPLRLDTVRGWLTPVDPGRAEELPRIDAGLRAVHVDPGDSRRVWVAGNAGTILYSEDGGRSWKPQNVQAEQPKAAAQ